MNNKLSTSYVTEEMIINSKKMIKKRFREKYLANYDSVTAGNIIIELYKNQERGGINKEQLIYEMSLFDSRSGFMKHSKKYYDKAKELGLLDEYLPSKRQKITKEEVIKFGENCKNRTDLYNKKQYYYTFALNNGFIDEIQFTGEGVLRQKITVEMIAELASTCKNKTELSTKNQSAYKKAMKLGILDSLRFNNAESTIKYLWENIETLTREEIKKELSKHIKNPEPVGEF